MSLHIAGQAVDLETATTYKLDFGNRRDVGVVPYELAIDKSDLLARLTPVYDRVVKELRHDDEVVGEFQPPFEGAVDYPTFAGLLELQPAQIYEFVRAFLGYDIVSAYAKELALHGAKVKWVLLNVEGIAVEGQTVRVTGKARPLV